MLNTARSSSTITGETLTGRLCSLARRHSLVAYVALAWALSWAYLVAMIIRGDVVTMGGGASQFPGLFGPLVAAVAVTAVAFGRDGVADLFHRTFRWRVGLRWYALAALPFTCFLAGVGIVALGGGPVPTLDDLATFSGLPTAGLVPVVLVVLAAAFGEEVGWRGFAQPQLERRTSFLRASLAVGAVWAIWHLPLTQVLDSYRVMGAGVVAMLVLGLGAGAIVLGWLYDRSGGRILMAALFHFGLTRGSATLAGHGLPAALATTSVMVAAALIVVVEFRRGRRGWAAGSSSAQTSRRPRPARPWNAIMTALLRSPLHGMFGPGMLLVTYRGRRSGSLYSTLVQFVRDADRLLVLVAQPSRKQWWRNVQEHSDVEVRLAGRTSTATAVVTSGAGADAGLARYVAARPGAARQVDAADRPVLVVLEVR